MRTQARSLVRQVRGVSGEYSPLDFLSAAGYERALERMTDAQLIEEHRRIMRQELRAMTDDELLAALEVEKAKLSKTTPNRSDNDDTDE